MKRQNQTTFTFPKISWFRAFLCIFLPPFSVIDYGCAPFIIVFILSLFGWLPGIVVAFIIIMLVAQETPLSSKVFYFGNKKIKIIVTELPLEDGPTSNDLDKF